MKRSYFIFLATFLFLAIFALGYFKKPEEFKVKAYKIWDSIPKFETPEKQIEPKEIIVIELDWEDYLPIRNIKNSNMGKVLLDIENHLPEGHGFGDEDLITSSHEGTHGIHNVIRNKYGWEYNAFYVLENRAILVKEPPTTINKVVEIIPQSWRGQVWQLYMISQAEQWNDKPLYIGDEWTAYINGTLCGKDLGITGIRYNCTMEYSCEFIGYAIGLAYVVKRDCPNYDDKQMRAWIMYNVERIMGIYNNEAAERMNTLRNSADSKALRDFAKSYFGDKWCQKVLGMP